MPSGTSTQSPQAKTPSADVRMRLSTTNPPVGPVFRPAAVPRAVFGTFFVQITARSAGSSPADVRTARILPSPTNASSVTP